MLFRGRVHTARATARSLVLTAAVGLVLAVAEAALASGNSVTVTVSKQPRVNQTYAINVKGFATPQQNPYQTTNPTHYTDGLLVVLDYRPCYQTSFGEFNRVYPYNHNGYYSTRVDGAFNKTLHAKSKTKGTKYVCAYLTDGLSGNDVAHAFKSFYVSPAPKRHR